MLPSNELWDRRFLSLAKEVSTWSKDPSTQVGAILVNKWRRIISTGYNGLPANLPDDPERLLDRKYKYENVIHAEVNCLNNLTDEPMGLVNGVLTVKLHELVDIARDCTIYTYPLLPCYTCANIVMHAGITRVVSRLPAYDHEERWNLQRSRNLFLKHDIECHEYYML